MVSATSGGDDLHLARRHGCQFAAVRIDGGQGGGAAVTADDAPGDVPVVQGVVPGGGEGVGVADVEDVLGGAEGELHRYARQADEVAGGGGYIGAVLCNGGDDLDAASPLRGGEDPLGGDAPEGSVVVVAVGDFPDDGGVAVAAGADEGMGAVDLQGGREVAAVLRGEDEGVGQAGDFDTVADGLTL